MEGADHPVMRREGGADLACLGGESEAREGSPGGGLFASEGEDSVAQRDHGLSQRVVARRGDGLNYADGLLGDVHQGWH